MKIQTSLYLNLLTTNIALIIVLVKKFLIIVFVKKNSKNKYSIDCTLFSC